ncbi:MAG: hypothetical protein D6B25_06740 [Desulfobulbaceae bacterium]|nr:MAG: hypothetical protein D6B25_06740 [Desulfobulbaceae bacterium]
MTRERFILHMNVADFAVAAERIQDAGLAEKPLIISPLQAARAVVYDMSEEAYGDGVRKGMALREAARLCRRAQILPPRFELYHKVMHAFVREAQMFSPLLESGNGDGHLFLDITGTHRLIGAPPDVGWRLRKQAQQKIGIDPIWSVAANKLVAKVASRLVKPAGEYFVSPGEEASFLAPLSVRLLPGIDSQEMARLNEFNITQVGQLATLDHAQLFSVFGKRGETLHNISHGVDQERIRPYCRHRDRVVREHHVLADDTAEKRVIEGIVTALAVRIGMKLRTDQLVGRRLALQLNYSDGSLVVRQASVKHGVSDEDTLRTLALLALERAWNRRTRVRSCILTCSRLHAASRQLTLFAATDKKQQRQQRLMAAMDLVRKQFGVDSLRFASQAWLQ